MKTIPSIIFRHRAMKAMKPLMSILVLVTLIAMAPSLIGQVVTLLSDADPNAVVAELYTEERITALTAGDPEASLVASQEILDGMVNFLKTKWPFMALSMALALLIGPVLTLGFDRTLLGALRREDIGVSSIFVHLPLFFKAIGLNLMVALRILLWMLPGMALSMAGAAAMVLIPGIGMLVMIAAFAAMIVPVIRAMYTYRLAAYVVADAPDTGVNAAIRRSREIMTGRRMELFSLDISFIGWRLLLSLAQTMLLTMMGSVIGMTLGMFASLFLQLYMYMSEAAFFQHYAVGPLPDEDKDFEQPDLNA